MPSAISKDPAVTDMLGGAYAADGPHHLASNGHVHQQMLDFLAKIRRGELEAPLPPPDAF